MRYVPYIKDEKMKIQSFNSGIPQSFQDKIELDEPNTLGDTIRKERYCYEQFKHKAEPPNDWKKERKLGFKNKEFKPQRFKNHGKGFKMSLPTKSVYQQNFPYPSGNKPFRPIPRKTDDKRRETLKCWGCGEERFLRHCPHR